MAGPAHIGKYRVRTLLGEGAMGSVYLAHDPDIDREVAIKLIHPHLTRGEGSETWRARFRQEARAAARCLHPNIVTVFELGEEEGRPYIVMEFVQGEELQYFIDIAHDFSLPEIGLIVSGILEGLAHAHAQGVVHRDIKPANIILLDNGGVKIADFGVARLDQNTLTQAGNMVGTPYYMAPEGWDGERVGPAGDLYSTGIILLELLTGMKPRPEQVLSDGIDGFLEQAFASERGQAVPPRLRRIVAQALRPRPEERFDSADAFIRALATCERSRDDGTAAESLSRTIITRRRESPREAHEGTASETGTLTPEMKQRLEQTLASHVGPMAGMLVERALREADTLEALGERLQADIPDEDDRDEFRRWYRRWAGHQGTLEATAGGDGGLQLEEAELERLCSIYAHYVGPLARNLVLRALRRA
ncbi:MAG: serine/threonine protein kinase, partial [Gammaproteobacteria bacterium]